MRNGLWGLILLIGGLLLLALCCGCAGGPSYKVVEVQMDPASPVGGKPVKLTCVVEAKGGEIPKNGGTNWHVSGGLLYIEEEIEDDHPAQNVLGKSSMSDAERVIFWIPPRERREATLTVQFRGSEPLVLDIEVTPPPKKD